ncbi:hypothetical protein GF351_06290 [Candidatus Woesearchaeota archaeon]|nr:hypothetical protein [Candidatus Woesearchaeota archaeon]
MSITKDVERYIQHQPSVKECLKRDMINYSKLSRQIVKDLGLAKKDFDAVLIACRRYRAKIKRSAGAEKKLAKILKESRIIVKNKMVVVELEKELSSSRLVELEKEIKKSRGDLNLIEGSSAVTVITSEEFTGIIEKLFRNRIINRSKGLVEIDLISRQSLEETHGWVAYLTTLLAEKGINIVETMSCWTDTLFVLDEKDLAKAMEVLKA